MEIDSNTGMVRYIWKNVVYSITVFFLLTIIVFILQGLYANYLTKKMEVAQLANFLAHNASLNNSDLVAQQVEESMSQDSTLKDIHFYTADNAIVFSMNNDSDWKNALINKSVNLHEEVIADNTSNYELGSTHKLSLEQGINQYANDSLDQGDTVDQGEPELTQDLYPASSNATLIGYISIIIDLQQLRKEWFRSNVSFIISTSSLFLVFLLFIYWRLNKPLITLCEISKQSQSAINQGRIVVNPLHFSSKNFIELNAINELVETLVRRYQVLATQYEVLQQKSVKHQAQHQSSTHNSSFQSVIVHELKDSLADISSGLQRIDSQYISNEQAKACAIIRKGVNDLEFTLKQIVQLNRIEKGYVHTSTSEIHPAQLIHSLIQEFELPASQKGLELNAKIRHTDHVLAGDTAKIRTILEELINNALRYTESGSITIDSRIEYFKESVRWIIQVVDTGIGISNKHIADVFVPFFQVSPANESSNKGRGIGLGVAYKLTQLIGGELTVKSTRGIGSTFCLVLTLQDWAISSLQTQLEGLNITAFDQTYDDRLDGRNIKHGVKGLEAYGASITVIKDSYNLLEHLESKSTKILLIAEITPLKVVKEICRLVREREFSQRVLIVWYQTNLEKQTLEALEAIGLDYIIDPRDSLEAQVAVISNWV